MTKKHKASAPKQVADPVEAPVGSEELSAPTDVEATESPSLEAPDTEALDRATAEAARWKDQYMRLAADMDNFRKRMQKERSESWTRAQGELAAKVLDALDDLGRVAHLDPEKTSAKDLAAGVELVERKLLKQFETAGLVRVGTPGEKFDPASHEAVTTLPAASPEQDHTVATVFQSGYQFGGVLLRPARVQVAIWQDAPSTDGVES